MPYEAVRPSMRPSGVGQVKCAFTFVDWMTSSMYSSSLASSSSKWELKVC